MCLTVQEVKEREPGLCLRALGLTFSSHIFSVTRLGRKGGPGNPEAVEPVAYGAALPSTPSMSCLRESHRSPRGRAAVS